MPVEETRLELISAFPLVTTPVFLLFFSSVSKIRIECLVTNLETLPHELLLARRKGMLLSPYLLLGHKKDFQRLPLLCPVIWPPSMPHNRQKHQKKLYANDQ